jgi:hypothetical protein
VIVSWFVWHSETDPVFKNVMAKLMKQSQIRMLKYNTSVGIISEINQTKYNQLNMDTIFLPHNYD